MRLLSRNNEVLATQAHRRDRLRAVRGRRWRAGRAALSPALLIAERCARRLRLPQPEGAGLRSHRPRRLRPRGAGRARCLRLYRARRLSLRRDRAASPRCCATAQGVAALGVPLTLVVERPDGVEYRRTVVPDQGVGGRALSVPLVVVGADRHLARARLHRSEAPAGRRDDLPGRGLRARPARIRSRHRRPRASPRPARPRSRVDGRYLYGAPAAGLDLEGEVIGQAGERAAGLCRLSVRRSSDEEVETDAAAARRPARRPTTTARRSSPSTLDKLPATTRPLEAQVIVRMAEAGGRAVERKLDAAGDARPAPMIGVKPLFSGRSLGEGENATFDVVVAAPDGTHARAQRPALRAAQDRDAATSGIAATAAGTTSRSSRPGASPTARSTSPPTRRRRISLPVQWGRYRLEVSTSDRSGPVTSVSFDAGWYADASADTPDLLEIALDKPEYAPGDTMTVAVTARTAGKVTLNVDRRPADHRPSRQDVQAGTARMRVPVGNDWGTGAYVVATLRRPLDTAAQRMPGRAIGVQWFSVDRKARTLAVDMRSAAADAARTARCASRSRSAGSPPARRRASSSPPSTSASSTSPTTSRRRRTTTTSASAGSPPTSATSTASCIDGMQGTRGQIRTGGDAAAAELQGAPPTQTPLALYSGIVTVEARRHRRGRVRHPGLRRHRARDGGGLEQGQGRPAPSATSSSAIRWCSPRRCRASCSPAIAAPCISTSTMSKARPATTAIEVKSEGVDVSAMPRRRRCGSTPSSAARVTLPLTATAAGIANVTVRISGPSGFALERSYALAVQPATQILARRTVQPIAKGESITLSSDLFADLVPGTRQRRGSRSASRPRSTPRRCWRRSTAIRSAARSRSPAARCRCSTSTTSRARRISRSTPRSTSASAMRSTGCWRGRARTARSACGRRAATMSGSTPTSPTS